jgi:uncharacterized damage-inducible protein DinB
MAAMTESPALEFIRYNNWANQEMFRICQELSDEELNTPIPGALGTIRQTLGHIVRAESSYLRRMTGQTITPPFDPEGDPSLSDVAAYGQQIGDALLEAARRLEPAQRVVEEGEDERWEYRAFHFLVQTVVHGVQHRTDIQMALGQGPRPAPNEDGWADVTSGWGYLACDLNPFDLRVTRLGG